LWPARSVFGHAGLVPVVFGKATVTGMWIASIHTDRHLPISFG
jgi:hypothetical protein